MPIELVFLGMSFFLNQPFFSTQPSEFPYLSALPHFPESPTSVQRFKPGYGYHRSSRPHKPPERYGFSTLVAMSTTLSSIFIPTCYTQAMEHECWPKAMEAELQALEENHTWDIVSCPPNVKPIGSKWVYTVKLKSDGSLDRYTA